MAGGFAFRCVGILILALTCQEITATAQQAPARPLSTLLAALKSPARRACDDYEPKDCPDQDGEFPVFLPDNDDCTRFFECSNGNPVHKDCSPGLHFDRWDHVCNLPSIAGCEDCTFRVDGEDSDESDSDSSSSSSSSSEEDGDGNDCSEEDELTCPKVDGADVVQLRNPRDCSSFFKCANGVPVLFECPKGLEYNNYLRVCDYPWRASCTSCKNE